MTKRSARKGLLLLLSALLIAGMLAGCGGASLPEVVEQTSLEISSGGKVRSLLISDFDKDYYNASELTNMAVNEAIAYNQLHPLGNGREAVVVDGAEEFANGSKVRLTMTYADCATYAEYNREILFYGTVAEAVKEGYDFNAKVQSLEGEETLTGTDLKLDGGRRLVITNAKAKIYCPRKVTHVTTGVTVNEDGSVNTAQTDAVVYILLK